MLETEKYINEVLKPARRYIDEYDNVKLIEDWQYDSKLDKFYMCISIHIESTNPMVPSDTKWYFCTDGDYPYGRFDVYPSVKDGINSTFYHQSNNGYIETNNLWRKGNICLSMNTIDDSEPMTIHRLNYNLSRTINWLIDASEGKLVNNSDLFELPDFSCKTVGSTCLFSFNEDDISLMQWEDIEATSGIAELFEYNKTTIAVKSFLNEKYEPVRQVEWGTKLVESMSRTIRVPWLRLGSVPVLNVWQAPITISDLDKICSKEGVNLKKFFKDNAKEIISNGFILVGFPIPKYYGGQNETLYWQLCSIKYFKSSKQCYNNFIKLYDKAKNNISLKWIISENWNNRDILQRGKVNSSITRKRILLVGAGTIGSCVSELLIREGAYNLTIADGDILEIGNLCRHTLLMNNINSYKAEALKNRLNEINPTAVVKSINKNILHSDRNINFDDYDVIIDCTASTEFQTKLENAVFSRDKCIFSFSFGLGVNHIYYQKSIGENVSFKSLYEYINEYSEIDNALYKTFELPRDGIGCWHPTFPATSSDVWIAATILYKRMVCDFNEYSINTSVLVYEKIDKDVFGYKIIKESTY